MAYMSQEGYDKLVAELQRLESVERPKASVSHCRSARQRRPQRER